MSKSFCLGGSPALHICCFSFFFFFLPSKHSELSPFLFGSGCTCYLKPFLTRHFLSLMSSWQVLSSSAGRLFLWSTLHGLSASPAPFPRKSPALSLGWVMSTVPSTPSFTLFSTLSSGTSSAKSCTYSAKPTGTGRRSDQDFLYSSLKIYFCLRFAVFVGEEGRRRDGSYGMLIPSPVCPLQGVTGKYQWIQLGYSLHWQLQVEPHF